MQKRQSAAQQAFNNELVQVVRTIARNDWGWTIPTLDDEALRDRIRCYEKTHIQNAKKRLATMLKNPRKVAHARYLVHHLHLIKQTLQNPKPAPVPRNKSTKTKPSSSPKDNSNDSDNGGAHDDEGTNPTMGDDVMKEEFEVGTESRMSTRLEL